MWDASGLREKILFTVAMIVVFRLGAQIPIWGVNPEALAPLMQGNNQLLGLLDMFSGGALTSISIVALGIGPYITSSIVMQLLTVVLPRLEELQKEEGEAGRRKIAQYTRMLTIGLAVLQSFLIIRFIGSVPGVIPADNNPVVFMTLAVLTLTAGSIFTMWLAEIITERGIGNGGSLLILSGILTRMPFYAEKTAQQVSGNPQAAFNLTMLLVIYLVTIGLIIILQESTRKIFIVSAKRQVGNRIYGGQNTHIPFKINPAGVMPIIFAFAVMAFPATIYQVVQSNDPSVLLPYQKAPILNLDYLFTPALWSQIVMPQNFSQLADGHYWLSMLMNGYAAVFMPGTVGYIVIEFTLIVFFTFFYASIIPSMQPREIAENLRKYGSAIPGIKPGRPTAEKLEEILTRTTFIGAVALAVITLVASSATTISGFTILQGLGATSLIIMVGVALDTMNQIRVHLLARQYQGFLK